MIIEKNYPIASLSLFATGGNADFFCLPTSESTIKKAVRFCQKNNIPLSVIGGGANILIADEGVRGMVIKLLHKNICITQENSSILVTIGAGCSINDAITALLDKKIIGLEEFSGIPGTIGGAVYMNIHYFSHLFSDIIFLGRVVDIATGDIISVPKSWFCFDYDYSTLHNKKYILYDITLQLKKGTKEEAAYAKGRATEIIRHRRYRYPQERTCGCFFKNFSLGTPGLLKKEGKEVRAAGFYLERVGVKDLENSGAFFSEKHANMIVSKPGGSTNDIIELANIARTKVLETFSLTLLPECQMIGEIHQW